MSIDTGQNISYNANFPVPNVDQSSQQFRNNFAVIKTAIENLHAATAGNSSVLQLTTSVNASTGAITYNLSYRNNALRLPLDTASSPSAGMIRYNTTSGKPEYYNGSAWVEIGSGVGGGESLPLTGGTVTGNVTIIGDLLVTGTVQASYYDGYVESENADLAERYAADNEYDPGTVVVFGGPEEITHCTSEYDTRVAGVISTDPAIGLNQDAGTDLSHPYVALIGRVPCKVVGNINKGDLLTTSSTPGHAMKATSPTVGTILGKALENHTEGGPGIIEISVVRC